MRRVLALALLAACGGEFGTEQPDAGVSCAIEIAVSPFEPTPGVAVDLTADVVDGLGLAAILWSVALEGTALEVTTTSPNSATFKASSAGVHLIEASGTSGGRPCASDAIDVNVVVAGAERERYELVVTPPAAAGWQLEPRAVEIVGGAASFSLGTLAVEPTVTATGDLAIAGQPVAAYLAARRDDGFLREANADGAFAVALPSGRYDLDVVPLDPALPPLRLADRSANDVGGAIDLSPGAAVGGVVRIAGAPLPGAVVGLAVAGAPAAIVTSAADGRFALPVRLGQPAVLTVDTPDGIALERRFAAGLADGAELTIELADLPGRTLAATVVADGGGAAAGARVEVVAEVPGAATVALTGGATASVVGRLRRTLLADAGGALPVVALPRVSTRFAIEPGPEAAADQAAQVVVSDLAIGAPATLALAAPGVVTGAVTGGAGQPLAGVRLIARPLGPLAGLAAASASAESDAEGRYRLALAPAAQHALAIDAGPAGRRSITVAPLAPGGTRDLPIAMAPTIEVTGRLTGGEVAGARVALRCASCVDDAPIAEAQVSATGRFVLAVADPGPPP